MLSDNLIKYSIGSSILSHNLLMLLYFFFHLFSLTMLYFVCLRGCFCCSFFFCCYFLLFCFGCFQVYYSSAMSSMLLISVSALFFVSNVIYFLSLEVSFGPFIYLQFFSSALQGFSLSLEHMGDIYDFFLKFLSITLSSLSIMGLFNLLVIQNIFLFL